MGLVSNPPVVRFILKFMDSKGLGFWGFLGLGVGVNVARVACMTCRATLAMLGHNEWDRRGQ